MLRKRKDSHVIIAVHITDRVKQASLVQSVLTKYGAYIKTRIGLHEATGKAGAPNGIVLLELVGAQSCGKRVLAELNAIFGVEARSVVFDH